MKRSETLARTQTGSGLARTCPTCCDHLDTNEDACVNCLRHAATLGAPLANVTALACHYRHHPIRDDLHNYKNPVHPDQPAARRRLAAQLAIGLAPHTGSIFVPVPSTTPNQHNHLAELITQAGHPATALLAPNQQRNQRNAHRELFNVTGPITAPVVVIEDTYVTGATAQSAAAAITNRTTFPVNIVAIGRRYRT